MSVKCSTETEGTFSLKRTTFTIRERASIMSIFFPQLYKSYEQAKEAVEKLRLQLYPSLFQSTVKDGAGDSGDVNSLEPIVEDAELSNELTEDTTSEAVGESDDAVRGENENDEDDDDDEDSVERTVCTSLVELEFSSRSFSKTFSNIFSRQ